MLSAGGEATGGPDERADDSGRGGIGLCGAGGVRVRSGEGEGGHGREAFAAVRTPDKIEMPAAAVRASATFSDNDLGSYTLEYLKNDGYITD
ncbi:hypothetical protein SSPO_087360 [Streptomyces antimycoticus]|uniref:Uncharacterized protein n=1 Tax=Streptomyces antimycoticus TaxID=68175 RepID=A0A499V0Y7_9ACTN|nr:hypothetical protein SSPO_087360 [Streptomyces antimycoticus]